MSETTNTPTAPNNDPAGGDAKKRWALIAGVLAIVAALIAVLFVTSGDDDEEGIPSPTMTEVGETTAVIDTTIVVQTTAPEATVATPVPDSLRSAVWPWADTDTRYADPVEAATGFAIEYLGFVEPIVGEFLAGDSLSGEVEVRAVENGPITVVFVRQLTDDDSWWILGASSANITVDAPEAEADITSPLTVSGSASAFEGTVDVELRADDNGEPIFQGFVTGSGDAEPGPFSESFEFTSPGETGGALVMRSTSPKDGSTFEATVLRIFYP